MPRKVVYALAVLPVLVIGLTITYGIVAAQARWDAAQYTRAALLDAQAATRTAEEARLRAEGALAQLDADYARFRASIGELLQIACRAQRPHGGGLQGEQGWDRR